MTPQQLKAMKQALEALKLLTGAWQTFGALDYGDNAITAIKEVLAEHAMREVQRLGQEIEQEPVAHCEAGPNYCWKCLEESNPTYGSEEIKKLREVNKSLMKNIEELKKEPPPFWPVVQHLLDEYGLQFIDIVAAYRESTQPEQEPVAWLSTDSIGERYLCFDKPLDNDPVQPLFTSPPQRTWVGLTKEQISEFDIWHDNREEEVGWVNPSEIVAYIDAKLKEKNT